jgi:hypothetical protein
VRDEEHRRVWGLVELLDEQLADRDPDWDRVRAAARELWLRVRVAA